MQNKGWVILCLLLVSSVACEAQDSTAILVGEIRAEYQRINREKLRAVETDPQSESSEGGEVKKYFSGDTLKKITTTYFGSIGKAVREYYFSGGQLFFAYVVISTYNKPMTGNVRKKEENRYYFHNGVMIRWLDENGKIKDKALYPAKAKEIFGDPDLR